MEAEAATLAVAVLLLAVPEDLPQPEAVPWIGRADWRRYMPPMWEGADRAIPVVVEAEMGPGEELALGL